MSGEPRVGVGDVMTRNTLFLLEDDPALRQCLGEVFERFGYMVRKTGSCGEAMLALSADSSPTVAVLDWFLLDGDAGSVARAIRAKSSRTVVVVMSGWETSLIVCPEADLIQDKPVDVAELLAFVGEAIDRRTKKVVNG